MDSCCLTFNMASASGSVLFCACILVSLCLSASALVKNDEHNLAIGERRPNDQELYKNNVDEGLIWFVKRETTVCFPDSDNNDKYRLTAIECVNKGPDKQYSGTAKLTSGGVGKSRACVLLEGYRGSPLKFTCKFYGYDSTDFGGGDNIDWENNDW